MEENNLELLYDHYKETDRLRLEAQSKRNTSFVICSIIEAVSFFFLIQPGTTLSIFQGVIKEKLGITVAIGNNVFQTLLWLLLSFYLIRYVQNTMYVERQYDYQLMLEKQLDENVYWTFSKTESRSDFEDDLKIFYNIIYNNILNNINYYYINIFKLKYNNIKKLYNIILNYKENKNIYLNRNILYIPHEGRILGLSLTVLEYCGIPMKKVLDKIKSNGINIIEDNKKFIFKLSKQLGNKKYALPYFI